MAICKLNSNLTRTSFCGYSLPEIAEIYLISSDDFTDTDISSNDGCEEISGITYADNAEVFKIEPNRNSASFEDTLVVADNGTKYRNASITFSVAGKYDACMHGSLDALSLGKYLVIVHTADDNYLAFGRVSPLEAETVTLAGGSDNNGLTVVLSGNVAESPLPLTASVVETMLTKVHSDE